MSEPKSSHDYAAFPRYEALEDVVGLPPRRWKEREVEEGEMRGREKGGKRKVHPV